MIRREDIEAVAQLKTAKRLRPFQQRIAYSLRNETMLEPQNQKHGDSCVMRNWYPRPRRETHQEEGLESLFPRKSWTT